MIKHNDIRCQSMSLTVKYPTLHALAASYHSSLKVEKIVQSVLCKKKVRSRCKKGAKRVLFPPRHRPSTPKVLQQVLCFYAVNAIRVSCRAACTVKYSRDIHVLTQYDGAKRTWWLAVFGALKRSKKITSPEHTSRDCLPIRTVVSLG